MCFPLYLSMSIYHGLNIFLFSIFSYISQRHTPYVSDSLLLRQDDYVFGHVGLFVYMSVRRIT